MRHRFAATAISFVITAISALWILSYGCGEITPVELYVKGTIEGIAQGQSLDVHIKVSFASTSASTSDSTKTVTAPETSFSFGPYTSDFLNATYTVTVPDKKKDKTTDNNVPSGQICSVANGTGTLYTNVNNILVRCGTPYSISGTVTGQVAEFSVEGVFDDGTPVEKTIAIGAATFTFDQYPSGTTYEITVPTPPTGQTCTVTGGSGTISADVNNITITCSATTYSVGGTVSGLGANKLVVLQNNGGDDLTVSANDPFTFATALANGATYNVTVSTQPDGQTCTPSANTGTISSANVTDVAITCVDAPSRNTIVLFHTAAPVSAIQTRATADELCVAAQGALTCPGGVRAFLGMSAIDEIRDMPSLYTVPTTGKPIVSSSYVSGACAGTNSCIADDWATLMSGTIKHDLDAAGVFPLNSSAHWWSGSTAIGDIATNTCEGWTQNINDYMGAVGYSFATDSNWIAQDNYICTTLNYLLCLCY